MTVESERERETGIGDQRGNEDEEESKKKTHL